MLLNIMRAKANEGIAQNFEVECTLPNDMLEERNIKFLTSVKVKGEFIYKNEVLNLVADASCRLQCICDNCGETFERDFSFKINEDFIENYNSHSDEDYLINQAGINIDEAVSDNLLLSLSSRMLCREDCKGLCDVCGKNKNFYKCNCEENLSEIERQEENPFGKIKEFRGE